MNWREVEDNMELYKQNITVVTYLTKAKNRFFNQLLLSFFLLMGFAVFSVPSTAGIYVSQTAQIKQKNIKQVPVSNFDTQPMNTQQCSELMLKKCKDLNTTPTALGNAFEHHTKAKIGIYRTGKISGVVHYFMTLSGASLDYIDNIIDSI